MLKRMVLRLLKAVDSIKRVEPCVEEVVCPVVRRGGVAKKEASMCEAIKVLGYDQIGISGSEVREGVNHTIWRHDGDISYHQVGQRSENVVLQ